jgi:hypothetical protein
MQCGGIASAQTITPGLPFNPALRFLLRDEARNMVSLAVARSDPDVPPVTANVLP